MSREIDKYDDQIKKLRGICDENKLTFQFVKDVYPMRLIIRPLSGFGEQMSMLDDSDGKVHISQDASIVFTISDGELSWATSKTFRIDMAMFNKIKAIFQRMHYFYLQFFHRDLLENRKLRPSQMPVIDEQESGVDTAEQPDGEEEHGEDAAAPDEIDADMLAEAIDLVRVENKATLSMLQRRFNISYSLATSIMAKLEELSVVGEAPEDGGPREVLPYDLPDDAPLGKPTETEAP